MIKVHKKMWYPEEITEHVNKAIEDGEIEIPTGTMLYLHELVFQSDLGTHTVHYYSLTDSSLSYSNIDYILSVNGNYTYDGDYYSSIKISATDSNHLWIIGWVETSTSVLSVPIASVVTDTVI